MKMKKLSEDHYIIMDDSEIKEGDYCTTHLNIIDVGKIHNAYTIFNPQNKEHLGLLKSCKKITYSTQPESLGTGWMQSVLPLLLSEVKELLGVVDVEKKAWKYNPVKKLDAEFIRAGYIQGYNEALEDKKEQKYTEKDLRAVFMHGFLLGVDRGDYSLDMENRALSTYTQPPTEWEVEFVDGKLKLKS